MLVLMNNKNITPDNQPNSSTDSAARQANNSDSRTTESRYQKLPRQYRPKVTRDQRDPIDYDTHAYPVMKQLAAMKCRQ
jgi:hypothetical protein